ncbi:MAG TPA: purine-nucleoside phosphorylase [Bacteroidota bacterium]|mgnify:CR=1 FL=1|jgi:purine-nucleoside phosphorylase|nr:purine-nucleoside phosphorylase [Bacteroidota bacterium]
MNARELNEAFTYIRSKTTFSPKIGIILGSGLGELSNIVQSKYVFSSSEIPKYPRSSVVGHDGKIILGAIQEQKKKSPPLIIFQGRIHYYESGSLDSVIAPIQLAYRLGIKYLIITNAAGGINSYFAPGDIMLIRDIINLSFMSIGKQSSFSSTVYRKSTNNFPDKKLVSQLEKCALIEKVPLRHGTYCWLQGPSYETAAEIQMLKRIGADAVGMSTVPEIYTALNLGIKVAGISLISNLGTGISPTKLSHSEVTESANKAKAILLPFMKRVLLTFQ